MLYLNNIILSTAKEKGKINLPEDRYPGTVRATDFDER